MKKKKVRKIETRLLKRIKAHILKEPKRLDMNLLVDIKHNETIGYELPNTKDRQWPACGTVGCIAGWAVLLSGGKPITCGSEEGWWEKGAKLLGLNTAMANRLFSTPLNALDEWDALYPLHEDERPDTWPKKFANRYVDAKTPRGRALATAARIDHFIKTKGAE